MHNSVTLSLNGKLRKFCTDCGVEITQGGFEAFNHQYACPYKASGRYFIPDDVRVRDRLSAYNFIPQAEVN